MFFYMFFYLQINVFNIYVASITELVTFGTISATHDRHGELSLHFWPWR